MNCVKLETILISSKHYLAVIKHDVRWINPNVLVRAINSIRSNRPMKYQYYHFAYLDHGNVSVVCDKTIGVEQAEKIALDILKRDGK